MKADREVYSVIRQGNCDPRWKVNDPHIIPDCTSRMFDPYDPDREPMPCDDPAAHRKMHNVGGMKGSKHWHDNGDTPHVENPHWRQYLLVNEKGEIPLDKEKAVELARLHAPEYQTALENLYTSAMAVSKGRFVYDVQFFGDGLTAYKVPGRGAPSLQNNAAIRAEKALATGGNWTVELANSITWTLNGQGTWRTNSNLLNVSVVQPVLRAASKKVVLENLTQAERNFLAELRKVALFQQGHYTKIVTGSAPSSSGVTGSTSGFYGLLAEQIRIQNQRQNIVQLEENLSRFEEMFEAGQVADVSQVEETRQSLLTSQNTLLGQINRYKGNVETYIRSLGLPPDLNVSISDPLLEQFQLTTPTLTVLMEDVGDILSMIRKKDEPLSENFRGEIGGIVRRTQGEIAVLNQDLEALQKSMPDRITSLKNLETFLADRARSGEPVQIAPVVYNTKEFEKRITRLRTEDIPQNISRLQAAFTLLDLIASTDEQTLRNMIREGAFDSSIQEALEELKMNEPIELATDSDNTKRQEIDKMSEEVKTLREQLNTKLSDQDLEAAQKEIRRMESRIEARKIIADLRQKEEYRDWIRRVFSTFQYELVWLSLMQTRARLDAMTLVPISVTPEEAFQTAAENRLDWMNRKATLVDTWRQIDIAADALKGVYRLRFDGGLGTIDRRGIRFDADTGNLDVRFEWESPLTRYNEMMTYRKSQMDYQKARRDYYTYVDSVQADLRNDVRNAQMRQIEFEINRNAVLVSTIRVDVMQLRMEQPPQRGGRIDTNASDQLIRALRELLQSQNSLLDTWVAYLTLRMTMDYNMGTMKLDDQGRWIDPGMVSLPNVSAPQLAPSVPRPIPVPVLEAPKLNRRYIEEE
jgi:hypothetical protein